ncbi:MAG: D-2-hydroxyacid dehydrogenase [Gammaproteobacteria bacterium]|nr:D-2-hydroxyacid dehydrogenase [Gammaproteobacteria bacterium]
MSASAQTATPLRPAGPFELLLYHRPEEQPFIEQMADAIERCAATNPRLQVKLHLACTETAARAVVSGVEAAYGFLPVPVFNAATKLRWLACPQAGPDPAFYHAALVDSDVVVTNVRGIYGDHISAHIMAYVLSFARALPTYQTQQREHLWQSGAQTRFLPDCTAVIIGLGGIGDAAARRCADFGMRVLAVDPRVSDKPAHVQGLVPPAQMLEVVGEADFVIVTAPETPHTRGLFDAGFFRAMRHEAFFINIGRGATVRLRDLDEALRAGTIAGAALDVFEVEPLPRDHPLWDAPNMLITPHSASDGPHLDERRIAVLVENCRRFGLGEPLRNVVDKSNWF